MLTEAAARRAGFTHWDPEVEGLVGDLVKAWGTEIAVLARAFQVHDTSILAFSGTLTFSSVARAVVTLLERTKQRFPVLYVRPFDGDHAGAGHATGFVVDAKRGLILTNRHVVSTGPVRAEATFLNKEEVRLPRSAKRRRSAL